MIFLASSRDGQARAKVVPDDKLATLKPVLLVWIDPEATRLMTNCSKGYRGQGKTIVNHQYAIHRQKGSANTETGAQQNTSEAVISKCSALWSGSATTWGRQQLQRYLDEIAWLEPPRSGEVLKK